jgi:hypothetical protein
MECRYLHSLVTASPLASDKPSGALSGSLFQGANRSIEHPKGVNAVSTRPTSFQHTPPHLPCAISPLSSGFAHWTALHRNSAPQS